MKNLVVVSWGGIWGGGGRKGGWGYWELLVPMPRLAMQTRPGASILRQPRFSSGNEALLGKVLAPPVPSPVVMSPPWIMNSEMMRWKVEFLKQRSWVPVGVVTWPFSPVQRRRKLGGVSEVKDWGGGELTSRRWTGCGR